MYFFSAVQGCDDHIFRHAVCTRDVVATRHRYELRLCLAAQKRLTRTNAPVGTFGQALRVTTVGDRQDVLRIYTLRDVFTLLEVTHSVVD